MFYNIFKSFLTFKLNVLFGSNKNFKYLCTVKKLQYWKND